MKIKDTGPYKAGAQAYLDGLEQRDCPFDDPKREFAWCCGFFNADLVKLATGEDLEKKIQEMINTLDEEADDDE